MTSAAHALRRAPKVAVEFIYTPIGKKIESTIKELSALRRLRHMRECRICVDALYNSLQITWRDPIALRDRARPEGSHSAQYVTVELRPTYNMSCRRDVLRDWHARCLSYWQKADTHPARKEAS
jgi:hypothetical protein